MSTVIRNELSRRNPYYLTKHRTLELKHFCQQYEDWKQEYVKLTVLRSYGYGEVKGGDVSDNTSKIAIRAAKLDQNMTMVKKCCKEAGGDIWEWLFMGVTNGLSYTTLAARGIPCGKDYYYERYRKFFWLLDKERG